MALDPQAQALLAMIYRVGAPRIQLVETRRTDAINHGKQGLGLGVEGHGG